MRLRIAYLVSKYPAVSHTFVAREITALRRQGVEIATFSVRTPPPAEVLSAHDRAEQEETCYILPPCWWRYLLAHVVGMGTRPARYLSTLWFALTNRPAGLWAGLWHLFYFVESVFLWHELRRREIGHLHVHFGLACATVAMITSRLGDLTYSLTVHGPTVFFDVHRFLLPAKVERAAFVFCISHFCRSQVMAHVAPEHWSKLHIVHCGVEGDAFRPVDRSKAAESGFHILCVGRLVPEKAQALLLRGVAELGEDYPRLHCTLVGDGPDRRRLEVLARDLGIEQRVTFAGAVGQDDIQSYYDEADLFVLPSFAEGLPVVLMEAMAKGLATVGTRIAGIAELIEDRVTGLLVAPGSPEELKAAIRALLDDGELRERLARNGREKVLREFEMSKIASDITAIIESSGVAIRTYGTASATMVSEARA